jgi:hypothetical protein
VVLPPDGPCKHLLGIPLSLPMGWSLSPSYFCAFTQTCTDLANDLHTTTQVRDFHFATLHQPDLPLHSTNCLALQPIPIRNTLSLQQCISG